MKSPLIVTAMIERAEKYFPKKEVISRTLGGVHRITYKEIGKRTRSLSSALENLGVKKGDRVGTLAWNHHRHLEAYFAIPSMGAVLHTINIRLPIEHLIHIINHAEDKVLLIDPDILPLIEKIHHKLETVESFIVMGEDYSIPESDLDPLYAYEQIVADGDEQYEYNVDIEEDDPAGMCYTSATTGLPKGVVYSHRGVILHSMALSMADTIAVSESDVAMPVVPMFHVNAWGFPFVAAWVGATQVLPGPMPTPQVLAELMETYKVTGAAGVPTIWLGLLKEIESKEYDLSSLRSIISGGAAAPEALIHAYESKHKIPFINAYGMTETMPLVALGRLKSYQEDLSEEERLRIRKKQGVPVPGVEIKVVNENGEAKRDGQDMGELLIRGPWIADEYYKDKEKTEEAFIDGWLHTGDVVTIDEEGNIEIVDRTKDLIKSGGEWISSVSLENELMGHDGIFEAAVVSVPHPKWQERPVACVVLHEGIDLTKEDVLEFLEKRVVKWWLPDDVLFMEEIPKTSVGKFLKRALRDQVHEHYAVEVEES